MENERELSPAEGYAAWAECYDDDGNPLVALEGPAVWSWLGDIRGGCALDLGCGTGRHTLALAQRGARVVATDQCTPMLERAAVKLRGHDACFVRHALPAALPFADDTFRVVVLGLVVEHVADLPALMIEVERVLGPGGRCILSALHPSRTAEGMRARFIDRDTGLRQPVVTYHRTEAEYLGAARSAGFAIGETRSLTVPASLARVLPRAERYVGQELGWVAWWTNPG